MSLVIYPSRKKRLITLLVLSRRTAAAEEPPRLDRVRIAEAQNGDGSMKKILIGSGILFSILGLAIIGGSLWNLFQRLTYPGDFPIPGFALVPVLSALLAGGYALRSAFMFLGSGRAEDAVPPAIRTRLLATWIVVIGFLIAWKVCR